MTGQEIATILQLLKVACPQLKRMAVATANPFDDIVVNLICAVATLEVLPEKFKEGGI